MAMVHCVINGEDVSCESGTTILEAARATGIAIPTLCYRKDLNRPASCRMCVVEVQGMPRLAASCSTEVTEGMQIETESERVLESRRRTLDLMCRRHRMDCEYCPDYTFCELHAQIRSLGLDDRKYSQVYHERNADESSKCIVRDNSKCIRCRRCVAACGKQGVEAIGALHRAEYTSVGVALPMAETDCVGCGQCVKNCPTGALFIRDDTDLLWRAKNNKKKIVMGIMPETARGIVRFFGNREDADEMGRIAAVAKKIGAEEVFDLTGMNLQNVGETAEKIAGHREGPITVSMCPAAKKHYAGDNHFIPLTSPEKLFHDTVLKHYEKLGIPKEELFIVYVSACSAEKNEHVCDAVLTTTELYQWIMRACVSRFTMLDVWEKTEPVVAARLAEPVCDGETSDFLECVEKVLREKYQISLSLEEADGFLALDESRANHAVTFVHACPGGCVNGGGQFRVQGYQK